MEINDLLPFLNQCHKGQIVTLATSRPAKVRKGAPAFTKHSVYQVRIGHDYEAQASTKAARAEGMEHKAEADDYAKRLNEHLTFHKESGRVYLACQPIATAVRSSTFVDEKGDIFSKEAIREHLLASELRNEDQPAIHIRVPIDTIVSIK